MKNLCQSLSDVSFPGNRLYRKLLLGVYIFFAGIIFKFMVWSMFCNIFVGTRSGNFLQLLFFWAHMLVVIAAVCFNSLGIIALCVGIYFINDLLYEFVHLLQGWNGHNKFKLSLHAGN